MNKYLITMALMLGIASSQATRLYIAFEDVSNLPVSYRQEAVAAEPVNADFPYDHVRLTFADGDSRTDYVLLRHVARELVPQIDEYFCPGIPLDPSSYLDLADPKVQSLFPGLSAQSFALLVRMNAQARDALCGFTQESLDIFVKHVVKEGLDAALCCATPVALALRLATILRVGLRSSVGNQLLALALTDEYLRMQKSEEIETNAELIKQLGGFLCGHDPISEAYNRMVIPFWINSKKFVGHTDAVYSVAYSPDGKHIVSGSVDSTIRIWSATTGVQEGLPLTGHTGSILSVAYSPDGKHIVSGSHDRTIRIWNATTGAQEGLPLTGHTGSIRSVAYSPDGKHIVSGSGDNTIRIWNAGDELDGLNIREQWRMLVRNAQRPFKDRDDALVTAREIVAAGETLIVDDKDCLKRGEIKEAVKFESCVDQGMRELLERNAPWQDVKEYLRAHKTALSIVLITRAHQYIEERYTGASSSGSSSNSRDSK